MKYLLEGFQSIHPVDLHPQATEEGLGAFTFIALIDHTHFISTLATEVRHLALCAELSDQQTEMPMTFVLEAPCGESLPSTLEQL